MTRALFLFLLTAWAAPKSQVIFWDMNKTPRTYRVLEDGVLSEPRSGVADGTKAALIVYATGSEEPALVVAGVSRSPEAQENYVSALQAIAEYNLKHLPPVHPGGKQGPNLIPIYIDRQTGLIVPNEETKGKRVYQGFGFFERPDGTWAGLNLEIGRQAPPHPMLTRIAEETRKALNRTITPKVPCPEVFSEIPAAVANRPSSWRSLFKRLWTGK
jgi:hypothetical protein